MRMVGTPQTKDTPQLDGIGLFERLLCGRTANYTSCAPAQAQNGPKCPLKRFRVLHRLHLKPLTGRAGAHSEIANLAMLPFLVNVEFLQAVFTYW